jgi:serine/threonine protein phosphatase 1
MLKKIRFSDSDTLYVLGDVVDWGLRPLDVLRDMSMRANVIPIMGNHEYAAHEILKQLSLVDITEESIKRKPGSAIDIKTFMLEINDWVGIGGAPTMKDFIQLPEDEREHFIEYLEEFSLYEMVNVNGDVYILTHSGLPERATKRNLHHYDAYDFATASTDYGKQYFDDAFLVTGHCPTFNIDEEYRGLIYRKHNHIAIDTGAAFGEAMGCVCLDTGEEFYV